MGKKVDDVPYDGDGITPRPHGWNKFGRWITGKQMEEEGEKYEPIGFKIEGDARGILRRAKGNPSSIKLAANTYKEAGKIQLREKNYQKAAEDFRETAKIIKEYPTYFYASEKLAEKYERMATRVEKVSHNEWHGLGWRKASKLEQTAATASIIGIIGGLFFLSTNITGNVIGSLNQTSSDWVGGILFIVGLIGAFAYFRRK